MSVLVHYSRSETQRKECAVCAVELRNWRPTDVQGREHKSVAVQSEEKVRREARPEYSLMS